MRIILSFASALFVSLLCLNAAQAQSTIEIGETAVLTEGDGGNANLLPAQETTLSQTATIDSLSFYVTVAAGKLILGIYEGNGPDGGPGTLLAQTNSFTPVVGWNTQSVIAPVSLPAGNYWLAYLPNNNNLQFVKQNNSGNCAYYSHSFSSGLPSTYQKAAASSLGCTPTTWSFYATLTPSSVTVVNGACGSSNGADLTSAPTTNLCSAGTASAVSGAGPWSWTCAGSNGGTTASCSANLLINGACGSANGVAVSSAPTTNLCSAGLASAVSGSGPWNWTCVGINDGTTASCSAPLESAAVNGACGSANGTDVTSAPTTNLCSAGTASAVTGSGPFDWTCAGSNGGTTASCSANLEINGSCGSANGVAVSSVPSSNLCTTGPASAVSGSGPWDWTCAGSNGGSTASCSAPLATSSTITIGDTNVESAGDGGNANLLLAQEATLSESATIESLSFYVTNAAGNLILGIYDATGSNGGPGKLQATTNGFAPTTGWNTASVVTPVTLAAGNYWLAYLPSSNNLGFVKQNNSGNCSYYSYTYGALPGTYGGAEGGCTPTTWSFYATLVPISGGGSPVNGVCGSSNGGDFTSAPTTNLCSIGTASSVSGSGPWTWSCAGSNGGTTASCSANLEINGACGSANGVGVSSAPTTNLCSAGTASSVTGSGPWDWTCASSNGGTTASCSAPESSGTSGQCGSANGETTNVAPTSNLCNAGTASAVSGSGPWTWTCAGSNGGTTASCEAYAPTSGSVTFTALHTYYMSPTGSDSNNGLTASTAWASPNHNVDCGDVILAAPGTYTTANGFSNWGTVSNCPSTSGGIDGKGGIYFASVVCDGTYVGACSMNFTGGGDGVAFDVVSSYWAVEGWQVTTNGGNALSFLVDAGASGTTHVHHVAFINDICVNSGNGFGDNESALNHNVPGNGVDYFAVIGSITQNCNQKNDYPSASIVNVAPSNSDTNAGVHTIFAGNFAIHNRCKGAVSDCEGFMYDTFDAHGYVGTAVMENNITYDSADMGLQVFQQTYNSSDPVFQIFNNTYYGNNAASPYATYSSGDMNFQLDGGFPWTLNVYNNISRAIYATNNEGTVYAEQLGGNSGPGSIVWNLGGGGIQNIFKGVATVCQGDLCDSGDDITEFNGFGTSGLGTNTYEDPGFQNTSDLLANHVGAPNCSGFTNTTACMGWNYSTQTATTNSVIYDLTPTASGMSGKGYQPPGPCASDPYYPAWLKGVVYLVPPAVNGGSTITEDLGLVQQPCGM